MRCERLRIKLKGLAGRLESEWWEEIDDGGLFHVVIYRQRLQDTVTWNVRY